jgi:hypothetical protein
MPALCSNRLTIWSDAPETLVRICSAAAPPSNSWLKKLAGKFGFQTTAPIKPGLFQFLCPMPKNVETLDVQLLPQLRNKPKSYFWRLENWGCQHDIAIDFERTVKEKLPEELRANFPTEYSPPVAALQHGAKLHGFRFRLLYCETGNGFCGIATESDNSEFELTFDRPPDEDGIPTELIEAFALNDLYDRHEE